MTVARTILFAGVCVVTTVATAQDLGIRAYDTQVAPLTTSEVYGVKLASICPACGVVTGTRAETRKGQAKGVGAVGGAVLGGVVGHEIGGGKGNAAMTVLGALGGGVA